MLSLYTNNHNDEASGIGKDLFARLMLINRDAFNLYRFNAAYHALAGAMHEAKRVNDLDRLAQVARTADEQLVWINCNAAEYKHSTPACNTRRTTSIYTLLSRQARTNERMVAKAQDRKRQDVCIQFKADT